jgi:hypothetical protein
LFFRFRFPPRRSFWSVESSSYESFSSQLTYDGWVPGTLYAKHKQ